MKRSKTSGMIIAGFTMLGMGIGFFTGNMVASMFVGIGVGFIAAVIVDMRNKNSDDGSQG